MSALFLSEKFLGIDLGTKNIKIVEVEKYKKTLILLDYTIIEFQEDSKLGTVLQTAQLFEENLGKILEEGVQYFKAKKVIFSIPSLYIFSTYFSLPLLPLSTLKNAIYYESKKYLPTSEENFFISWRNKEIKSEPLETNSRWFIFFTATPKNFIQKLKNISSIAKLKFEAAELEYFATEAFFKKITGNKLVVDLGYGYTNVSLISNGQVIFVQKLKFNSKILLETFSSLLALSKEESEAYFKKLGFRIPPEQMELKENIDHLITDLADEILKTKAKLEEQFFINIDTIYFTGGLVLSNGFLDIISSKITTVPINILNPGNYIRFEENFINKDKLTIFTNAIGCCLKYFGL